ncbi:MAG: sigma-54-dependent Fis family transcriptional regulator [Gammaproteobacteria bacterium]|nr:MAG: sigma-54-dependent Fis family transcriptional regulator [Gammaproteobacteria bacterium]
MESPDNGLATSDVALPPLLLIDDDPLLVETSTFLLQDSFHVYSAKTRTQAHTLLQSISETPVVALVDLGLPPTPHTPQEGFALIADLLAFNSMMRIIVLSGQSKDSNVQHAMTLGAADFIAKPCAPDDLKKKLLQQTELYYSENSHKNKHEKTLITGKCPEIINLNTQIKVYAKTPFPVLITGESGSGKELIANELHNHSNNSKEPFLVINCAAFSAELLDSQLFGHTKGSFTGADKDKTGFFTDAGKGTLFLDEIGEMPLDLQSKLLRVLENGEFYPIGKTAPHKTEARIIAATNRDLLHMVEKGLFRHDLYHRLSVLTLNSIAVCNRGNDKLLLLEHFQETLAETVPPFTLSNEAEKTWLNYTFPGNVRELKNIVIRIGTKHPGQIVDVDTLLSELEQDQAICQTNNIGKATNQASDSVEIIPVDDEIIAKLRSGQTLDDALHSLESAYIQAALKDCDGNLSKAAKLLQTNRTTLYGKMQRLGLMHD